MPTGVAGLDLVLSGGLVVQRGTHEQMKDTDGPYKYLMGH